MGKDLDFRRKGFLIPAVVTVATVALLLKFTPESPKYYAYVLVLFVAFCVHYVIYRLCGKHRAWQVELICFAVTVALYRVVMQFVPESEVFTAVWPVRFFQMLLRVAMPEELTKILPLFLIIWVVRRRSSDDRARFGIAEPLDGILYGAASGSAFAVSETFVRYMPQGEPVTDLRNMMTAIAHALGEIFGHAAYSGYFGYFVGLAMLKPKHKWKLLGIGLASSSIIHGVRDTMGQSVGVVLVVGTASYFALIAAILKARQISPTRAINFATRTLGETNPADRSLRDPIVAATPDFKLVVDGVRIPLIRDAALAYGQLPGLTPRAGDGIVAAVSHNPKRPKILGLKNCSVTTWSGQTSNGTSVSVHPGQSVRLEPGLILQLGSSSAVVE